MPEPPGGTVTFLFTDIEGSTKRWEQQREAMSAALQHHDAIPQREALYPARWLFSACVQCTRCVASHGCCKIGTNAVKYLAAFRVRSHYTKVKAAAPTILQPQAKMATAYNAGQGNEALVLSDEEGNYYAIPRETVERHRLTPKQKSQLERELGDDVAGHTMYEHFITQQRVDSHQAELRQQAAEERLVSSTRPQPGDEQSPVPVEARRANGIRGLLVGAWRTLSFVRPAPTNP